MAVPNSNRVVIEGIDGSGKSTAALRAAELLSSTYPESSVKVVDSSGVHKFARGELTETGWDRIEGIIPKATHSKLRSIAQLGAFTTARRMVEGWLSGSSDLVVSVRDPFRIDPALYATVYEIPGLRRMDLAGRLRFFNRFAMAPHPASVVMLEVDSDVARTKLNSPALDYHETGEKMAAVAEQLPVAVSEYARLYGCGIAQVKALQGWETASNVAAQLEPALAGALNANDTKHLTATYL